MSAADEILRQRRAELAGKFLRRSQEEAAGIRARLVETCADAPLEHAADLKMFAHKISGTGATLGLDSLSELGRELEMLLSRPAGGADVAAAELEQLRDASLRLLEEVERLLALAR